MPQALELSERTEILQKLGDSKNLIGLEETRALLSRLHQDMLHKDANENYIYNPTTFADVNEARCSDGTWLKMINWKHDREGDSNYNLYIIDCFRKQFVQCLPGFEQSLQSAIEPLNDVDRKQLEILYDIFKNDGPKMYDGLDSERDKTWIQSIPHFGSGLLQMASREKSTLIGNLKARLVSDELKIKLQLKSVLNLCLKLTTRSMEYAAAPFVARNVYPNVGDLYPEFVSKWIPKYMFCEKFISSYPIFYATQEKDLLDAIVKNYRSEKQ